MVGSRFFGQFSSRLSSLKLRFLPYGKSEIRFEVKRPAFMVRAVRTMMPRTVTTRPDIFRTLAPKPRPPYEEVWHLWQVFVPRRSITGRLLWGTVCVGETAADGFTRNSFRTMLSGNIAARPEFLSKKVENSAAVQVWLSTIPVDRANG